MELDRASLDSGPMPGRVAWGIRPKTLWLPYLSMHRMDGESKGQAQLRIKQSFSKGSGPPINLGAGRLPRSCDKSLWLLRAPGIEAGLATVQGCCS